MFDFLDIAIHVFLMDEPVTGCFPRFLGVHQFEMESPEQSGNQFLHLHQGNVLHVKIRPEKLGIPFQHKFVVRVRKQGYIGPYFSLVHWIPTIFQDGIYQSRDQRPIHLDE